MMCEMGGLQFGWGTVWVNYLEVHIVRAVVQKETLLVTVVIRVGVMLIVLVILMAALMAVIVVTAEMVEVIEWSL